MPNCKPPHRWQLYGALSSVALQEIRDFIECILRHLAIPGYLGHRFESINGDCGVHHFWVDNELPDPELPVINAFIQGVSIMLA